MAGHTDKQSCYFPIEKVPDMQTHYPAALIENILVSQHAVNDPAVITENPEFVQLHANDPLTIPG